MKQDGKMFQTKWRAVTGKARPLSRTQHLLGWHESMYKSELHGHVRFHSNRVIKIATIFKRVYPLFFMNGYSLSKIFALDNITTVI